VILHVDPVALTETARPLRAAVDVARGVTGVRAELDAVFAGDAPGPVHRATETFLDAWSVGLRGVSDRAERLVTALDTAAAEYADAEDRMRRAAAAGPDGGAA
jgi:hypothetical protein